MKYIYTLFSLLDDSEPNKAAVEFYCKRINDEASANKYKTISGKRVSLSPNCENFYIHAKTQFWAVFVQEVQTIEIFSFFLARFISNFVQLLLEFSRFYAQRRILINNLPNSFIWLLHITKKVHSQNQKNFHFDVTQYKWKAP